MRRLLSSTSATCHKEIDPDLALVFQSAGEDRRNWIGLRLPTQSELYCYIEVGEDDDVHFCSVDCVCEYIKIKAKEPV